MEKTHISKKDDDFDNQINSSKDIGNIRKILGLPEKSIFEEIQKNSVQNDEKSVSEYLEARRIRVAELQNRHETSLSLDDDNARPSVNNEKQTKINPLRNFRKKRLLKRAEKLESNIIPILEIFEKKSKDIKYQDIKDSETIKNLAKLSSQITEDEFDKVFQILEKLQYNTRLISPDLFKSSELTEMFINLSQLQLDNVDATIKELNSYDRIFHSAVLIDYSSNKLNTDAVITLNIILNGEIPDEYKKLLKAAEKIAVFSTSGLLYISKDGQNVESSLSNLESIASSDFIFKDKKYLKIIDHFIAQHFLSTNSEEKPTVPVYFYEFLLEIENAGGIETLNNLIDQGVDLSNFLGFKTDQPINEEKIQDIKDRLEHIKSMLDDPEKKAWMEILHEINGHQKLNFFELESLEGIYEERQQIVDFITIFDNLNQYIFTNSLGNDNVKKIQASDLFELSQRSDGDRKIYFKESKIQKYLDSILLVNDQNLFIFTNFLKKNLLEHTDFLNLKTEELPLLNFLSSNIDEIDIYLNYDQPTVALLEKITKKEIELSDEVLLDWLNNSSESSNIDPELLLQFIDDLENPLLVTIIIKYDIDVLEKAGLPVSYSKIFKFLKNVETDIQRIIATYDKKLFGLFEDNKPNSAFFDFLLSQNESINLNFIYLLTDEALQNFSSPQKEYWQEYRDGPENMKLLLKKNKEEIEEIIKLHANNHEKIQAYFGVISRIAESSSQEIQRLKEALVSQLLEVDDPIGRYEQIEDIFVANNLPTFGKIYKVFLILHPEQEFSRKLDAKDNLSPILKAASPKEREAVVYRDLLNISIKNNNKSLEKYLSFFQQNGLILQKFEELGWNELTNLEQQSLATLLRKSLTLRESDHRLASGLGVDLKIPLTQDDVTAYLKEFKNSFKIPDGELLSEGIIKYFTKDLGFKSIKEILEIMEDFRISANKRGIKNAELAISGQLDLESGDLIKAIDEQYFGSIIQNANLAKEFLGAGASSDFTPFDTDVSRVLDEDLLNEDTQKKNSVNDIIEKSPSGGSAYGNIKLIFKDRGQFKYTEAGTPIDPDSIINNATQYEAFPATSNESERHWGIRTGIPFTEVDFIVVEPVMSNDLKKMESIFFAIAENNYYIPILDSEENLIYTPEMFEKYRKIFEGIPEFSDKEIQIDRLKNESVFYNKIADLKEYSKENFEQIRLLQQTLRKTIEQVLQEYDIPLQGVYSQHLGEAELHDTGSTGRFTNVAGDADFDLLIRLDNNAFKKVPQLRERLIQLLKPLEQEVISRNENTLVKMSKTSGLNSDELIDVDIFFVNKSAIKPFATYDAVTEKLLSINNSYGEDVHHEVIANILLTKQILKEAGAYKKQDGGFGGVGVENWILQHGGNIEVAFNSFWEAAHNGKTLLSLDQFKIKYPLRDPGLDLIGYSHDNFINFLSENAYQKIIKVISNYLNKK